LARLGNMGTNAKDLLEQALQLDEDERVLLAHDLLESVGGDDRPDFSPEWIAELARRVDLVAKGEAGPDEDWRVVLDRIRRRHLDQSA